MRTWPGIVVTAVFASVVALAAQTPPQTPPPQPPAAPATPAAPAPAAPSSSSPATAPTAGPSTGAGTAPSSGAPKSAIIERVIVRVNGEIFTQSQLTQRQIQALRDMDPAKRNDANLEATVAEITPDLLVTAVDELLLVQRGREMGVKFTDDQFKDAVDNIKKDNKLDEEAFKTALKQEGLTLDELRQQLEKTFLIRAVQQREIGPSMSITQEEQRQYYDKHKADFMTPMTVTLREILVTVPTSTQRGQSVFSVASDNAAKAKIDALRARAAAGEDFVALVNEASESTTKTSGGLIGPVNFTDLTTALQDALNALQPGGVTPPLRGARGYQIFKLESRSTPELRPFDAVRPEIERAIRDERIDPETQKMLVRLRKQAVIEWKDDSFKETYEKQIAKQAALAAAPSPSTPAPVNK
jgi:peptidyl-prolyl cis-trans isomerase SurA